jgi:homoserine kinase type II
MNPDQINITTTQENIFKSNRRIISEHYDIGELASQDRIYRGYIDDIYKIETLRNGKRSPYLMRRYCQGTPEEKVKFEHSLLHELQVRRFKLSPRLIMTKDGKTYVRIGRRRKNQNHENLVAVSTFMPGEDKYTWDRPLCSDKELINSAQMLALYHNTIFGWQGADGWAEQSSMDAINSMALKWRTYARNASGSSIEKFFLGQLDELLAMLKNIPSQEKYNAMPRIAVHGDYHPGNLKFQGGQVTGVLDFGWSRIDARCLDVGLAIVYFCTSWKKSMDGNLKLDCTDNFLRAYQGAAKKNKTIGPLNRIELENLPQMIHAGNLIVMDWILSLFDNTGHHPEKFWKYFKHNKSLDSWLQYHRQELADCLLRHYD